ncbi:MAG TPA: polyprenol monophosphomannose synthase [Acidobacteriota bacterium]|nr:polyprenol monophosphomannose synthase [Acidobacteriota bacterium]
MADERRRIVVMIPTYNEAENITDLAREILALPLDADLNVLVVDDDSPDGTGRIAEALGRENGRVQALIRTKRRGRGAAGLDGFKAALALGPDLVVEMDGDFSHPPRFIPDLVTAMDRYDVVLGSRFVPGGRDADRSLVRRFITLLVRLFIRRKFRFPVKDVSSGFRCFRREVLEAIDLDDCISVGPSVVLEVLYKAFLRGYRIGEVPIVFVDRKKGKTKLDLLTLVETLVAALRIERRYDPAPGRSPES